MAADRLTALRERTRYEPAEVEARVFARWEEAGVFHPAPEGDAAENFSIAIPPPNVTGALHLGHALNGSIQDVLIRLRRMQGRRTKWIFGTDHAGIATQVKVEEQLAEEGSSRQELGREAFIERVEFTIDGKKRQTVLKANHKNTWQIKIDPRKFKPGPHTLRATAYFHAEAQTPPRKLRLRFERCVKKAAPRFTG